MRDSRVVRVAVVFGYLGFMVFLIAAMVADPGNRETVQYFVFGGLGLVVLCGLVVGLVWALGGKGDQR